MKVYVSTCDKFDHLMPGFARQFNRYWGADQEVVVLGFRQPQKPLPANFSFVSLAPEDTEPWTTSRRRFFESIPDTHFVFLLEDYWLTKPVDRNAVNEMENRVKAGAVKGDLSLNTKIFAHTELEGMVVASPDARYRTSMQPCIWSRAFMLDLMLPGMSPWEFELQQNPKVRTGQIVGPTTQIYNYANILWRGVRAPDMIAKLSAEDRRELNSGGMFDGI